MKGKTAPKAVRCIENDTIYKSINANRLYHGYTFEFCNESSTTISKESTL